MWEPAAIIVVLVLSVVLVRFLVRYRQRRQMLAELALRLDMRFHGEDRVGLLDRLGGTYLAQQGHSSRAVNVIQGRRGDRHFFCFDSLSEIGAGSSRTVRHRTVVYWQQTRPLPAVVGVRDEGLDGLGRFADFRHLRTKDGDFDSHFDVFSDEPDAAVQILSEPLRRNLLRCGDIGWEFCGRELLLYSDKQLSFFEIGSLIWRGWRCCDLIEGRASSAEPFPARRDRARLRRRGPMNQRSQ